jgi:TPR repeat protein
MNIKLTTTITLTLAICAVLASSEAIAQQGLDRASARAIKKFELNQTRAAKGVAVAQYRLGLAYLTGTATEKDEELAVSWFRKAAEQNNNDAQFQLAKCLMEGIGLKENPKEGVALLKQAAEFAHCNTDANYLLGSILEEGKLLDLDEESAVRHLVFAAEEGHPVALYKMARRYSMV